MYCTTSDILKSVSHEELVQLTAESGSTPDQSVVEAKIGEADSLIDSYVGVRYAVPMTSPPKIVNTLSVQITLYFLFMRRAQRLGGIPDAIKQGYDGALRILESVSKGQISLGTDPAPVASGASKNASFESDEREYTKDTLRGM